ncbi:hypothetical protein BGZ63DRAFT_458577 [Mariannaea sp. PMI_226]|nr:hypothetical protein BGZ63DRAFT_458577 [Mariannaea sp. PMI_226]
MDNVNIEKLNFLRTQITRLSKRRWKQAKNWQEIIALNREFLLDGRHDRFSSTPYKCGPTDDPIPLTDMLLNLHKYGMLLTDGTLGEVSRVWADGWRQTRSLPTVNFFLRDEGPSTKSFLQQLLNKDHLYVQILDPITGGSLFNTKPKETILDMTRQADALKDLGDQVWERCDVRPRDGLTLSDFCLENVRAVADEPLYLCFVTLDDGLNELDERTDTEFLEAMEGVNILQEIQSLAENTGIGRNQPQHAETNHQVSSFTRDWLGRGLMGFHRRLPLKVIRSMLHERGGRRAQ